MVLVLVLMLILSLLLMAMIGIHIRHFGRYGLCPDSRGQA